LYFFHSNKLEEFKKSKQNIFVKINFFLQEKDFIKKNVTQIQAEIRDLHF